MTINKKNKELLSSIIHETEEAFEKPPNDTQFDDTQIKSNYNFHYN